MKIKCVFTKNTSCFQFPYRIIKPITLLLEKLFPYDTQSRIIALS